LSVPNLVTFLSDFVFFVFFMFFQGGNIVPPACRYDKRRAPAQGFFQVEGKSGE
jgi:hypothetical protein